MKLVAFLCVIFILSSFVGIINFGYEKIEIIYENDSNSNFLIDKNSINDFDQNNDIGSLERPNKTKDQIHKNHEQVESSDSSYQLPNLRTSQIEDFEVIIPSDLSHPRGQIIQSMIENHSTLGTKYNYVYTTVGGSPGDRDALVARLSAGDYPNLLLITLDWYTEFAYLNIWEKFSPLIQSWSGAKANWINDIPDGWWNVLDLDQGDGDGDLIFALPFFGQNVLPYVNVDHFKAAGLNHTHPGDDLETIDEWLSACDTLANNGFTPFSMVGTEISDIAYMNYMFGSTDNFINSRYYPSTVYPWDSSDLYGVNGSLSVEGLSTYLKMKGEGWVPAEVDSTGGVDSLNIFAEGNASMVLVGPWAERYFEPVAEAINLDLNYTAVDMPSSSDGIRSTIIGGGISMVPKYQDNALKQDAMDLAEWLLEDENQMKTVRNWLNHSWRIPVRESLKNDPWFTTLPNRTNFIKHIETQSYSYPWGKQQVEWMNIHDNLMIPSYKLALNSITWNGSYTDADYTQIAQTALDLMALEIETNYLAYTVGKPIYVYSDSDFKGFPGFGTEIFPFRITGLNITATSGDLIYISGTNAYFEISNCFLSGLNTNDWGIHFENVYNGIIAGNIIINTGYDGISIDYSTSVHIINNTISKSNWGAILLSSSNWNTVEENIIFENGVGIVLGESSSNNIVFNNSISASIYVPSVSRGGGIGLSSSSYNTISNNTIMNCDSVGIWTDPNSNNHNIIIFNEIFTDKENFEGISLSNSNYNLISENTIFQQYLPVDNGQTGIKISASRYNEVLNNIIYNLGFTAISLESTSYENLIFENQLIDNKHGLVSTGMNNEILNNNMKNNEFGIYVSGNNDNFSQNQIHHNDWGLIFDGGSHNILSKNIIYENRDFEVNLFSGSANNNLERNDFSHSESITIMVWDNGINNSFSKNYWNDWTGTGSYSLDGSSGNSDDSPLVNPFHLSTPDLISPTSDHSLLKDNVTLKWTNSIDLFDHPITYSLFYSSDDGLLWIELASGLDAAQYTFDSNILPKDKLITFRIDVTDSIGFVSQSIIDTKYELWTRPTVPTVLYPNGGETLNEPITIRWDQSLDPDGLPITYSVYYSADGGAIWNLLKNELTSNSLVWNTTELSNGLSYLIKVVAINSDNVSNEDISDSTFIVENTPPISITIEPTGIQSFTVYSIFGFLILLLIHNNIIGRRKK
jgi:parallel beta-helix repeat protein